MTAPVIDKERLKVDGLECLVLLEKYRQMRRQWPDSTSEYHRLSGAINALEILADKVSLKLTEGTP